MPDPTGGRMTQPGKVEVDSGHLGSTPLSVIIRLDTDAEFIPSISVEVTTMNKRLMRSRCPRCHVDGLRVLFLARFSTLCPPTPPSISYSLSIYTLLSTDPADKQRGSKDELGIINDDEVRKVLQSGTERNYDRSVVLWDVYARRTPGANLNNFETPKDFMRKIAHVIDSRYGDPEACLTTVVQYWKNLTAGWRRAGRPQIKDDVVLSTSNLFKGPLQKEMNLAH
ncbi:hypothetical protein BJV78DRAFT_1281944 [Lactifluus subvellereus]|nr:hypothetical protein BJV78DRAFT_1281944 [Lactifluus subvellereus]